MSEPRMPGLRGAAPVIVFPLNRAVEAARAEAFARAFTQAGWNVVFHAPIENTACVRAAKQIAGTHVLPVSLKGMATERGAGAWLAACAEQVGVPRCLVTAPADFDEDGDARSLCGVGDGDEDRLLRLTAVNVAVPLALTRAFSAMLSSRDPHGLQATRNAMDGPSSEAAVIHLIEADEADYRTVTLARLSFALTQASVSAAIAPLALACAPRLRVLGLRTPLREAGGQPATAVTAQDQAQALLYLADAVNVTGATLLLDGGARLTASQ